MITFKQYLVEMGLYLTRHTERSNAVTTNKAPKDLKFTYGKHISTMSSGHHVYHREGGYTSDYHAVDPNTGLSHMHMIGKESKNPAHVNKIKIEGLSGRKGGTVKAHDFYHHLITKHDKELASNEQSPGGHAVWSRMSDNKDIEIHSHNIETGEIQKNIKIDRNDYKKYHAAPEDKDQSKINNLLIAKKRSL